MSTSTDAARRTAHELPAAAHDGGEFVFLGMPDLHGALRGKALSRGAFEALLSDGGAMQTDLLLALDPVDEPIADHLELGLRSGAADLPIEPEPETLRPLAWRPGWQVCVATPHWADGRLCDVAPRNVLAGALRALEQDGTEAMACFEYEVRLRRADDGSPLCAPLSYSFGELAPFDRFVGELQRALEAMTIELTAIHTEAGPGLLEINLGARRGIVAADEAMLVKLAVKDIARSLGLTASFLAKTAPEQEGSSGHLHLSLWRERQNLFADGLAGAMSPAVAGALEHMPGASLLYNPNLNSYKRLVPGYFAPVNATWGADNRSAAVRVVAGGSPRAARIELRRPGADANPYLALAAALASVRLGIRAGASLPPASEGDVSEAPEELAPALPGSLEAAIAAFAGDGALREELGESFANYLLVSRRWELRAWQRAVTDWERERYERTA